MAVAQGQEDRLCRPKCSGCPIRARRIQYERQSEVPKFRFPSPNLAPRPKWCFLQSFRKGRKLGRLVGSPRERQLVAVCRPRQQRWDRWLTTGQCLEQWRRLELQPSNGPGAELRCELP